MKFILSGDFVMHKNVLVLLILFQKFGKKWPLCQDGCNALSEWKSKLIYSFRGVVTPLKIIVSYFMYSILNQL
jgi:hypothetical protein